MTRQLAYLGLNVVLARQRLSLTQTLANLRHLDEMLDCSNRQQNETSTAKCACAGFVWWRESRCTADTISSLTASLGNNTLPGTTTMPIQLNARRNASSRCSQFLVRLVRMRSLALAHSPTFNTILSHNPTSASLHHPQHHGGHGV